MNINNLNNITSLNLENNYLLRIHIFIFIYELFENFFQIITIKSE